MKQYKARGVVLNTLKYGESSIIAHILTDVAGRRGYMVQGLGKGKGSSRGKGALFQPMFLVEFVGLESNKMDLDRLKEVTLAEPLQTIPFDVRKSTIALFMSEVLYKLVREVEPNSPLFEFVYDSVVALDRMNEGVYNFHLWFMVALSRHLGFYPSGEYAEGMIFDIESGCFAATPPLGGLYINADNTLLFHQLLESSPADLAQIALSRVQRKDFLGALLAYYGYHLDTIHTISSLRILSEVF
ncbi:MAG: DNA repair protein RecO [Tidjanibacter sp.]|nr:DNA repair protein RecO [Tidjanibacter sp.]